MNIISWLDEYKHLKGQHNQKRHGWRYSAGVPLSKLRHQRDTADEGYDPRQEWTQYKKRVITRHGLNPKNKLTFDINKVVSLAKKDYKPMSGESEITSTQKWKDWKKTVTPGEAGAISNYTASGYIGMNMRMRMGKELTAGEKLVIKGMDAVTERYTLDKDTELYRGTGNFEVNMKEKILPGGLAEAIVNHNLKVGSAFTDHGFTSSSIATSTGKSFGQGLYFVIHAPKGTKGIYPANLSSHPGEREFIMPKNTKYMITGIKDINTGKIVNEVEYNNSKPKVWGNWEVSVTVVGQD